MSGSFTLAQYQALSDAIARGVREVGTGANKVVYASTDEMLRLRGAMRAELEAAGALDSALPAVTYASWDRA